LLVYAAKLVSILITVTFPVARKPDFGAEYAFDYPRLINNRGSAARLRPPAV